MGILAAWKRRFNMLHWLWRHARAYDLWLVLENDCELPDFISNYATEECDARFAEVEQYLRETPSLKVVQTFHERLARCSILHGGTVEGMLNKSLLIGAPTAEEIADGIRFSKEKINSESPDRIVFENRRIRPLDNGAIIPSETEISVSFYHHGLRFASDPVKRYVAGKIFIDAGAYHGESSLTLAAYNPGMILAFEISPRNFKILQRTLRRSGSHGVNIVPLAVGLGDTEKDIGILDDGSDGTRINRCGTTTVHVSTLDNVMQKYHEPVGFVKADLEGGAFDMLKGMRETLLRDRPVLALYVYHSPEEFFGCFEYLCQPEFNYHLEFQHHDISASLSEIALIGIPAELFS